MSSDEPTPNKNVAQSDTVAVQEVMSALKRALRKRRVSYSEVGRRIGVSEQTIKRMFRDADCSLSRLSEICRVIDVKLADLVSFAAEHVEPLSELSPDQQRYLADRPDHFTLLFLLVNGESVASIQSHYALSDHSMLLYLRDLDRAGFIELSPFNRVRLRLSGPPLMRLHGPLHERIKRANLRFVASAIDRDGKDYSVFSSSFRRMSAATIDWMRRELEALNERVRKRAQRDALVIEHARLVPVKWVVSHARVDPLAEWTLPEHPLAGRRG